MNKGIDISMHQGDVDFKGVKRDGYQFVIAKITEGQDYIDPAYLGGSPSNAQRIEAQVTRRKAARDAGLVYGAYHFLRPRPGRPGSREAKWYLDVADRIRWGDGDIMLVMDLESTALPEEKTQAYVRSFCAEVEDALDQKVLPYTYPSFWTDHLGNPGSSLGSGREVWIAHYGVSKPTVPRGWEKYIIHQHSSTGRVGGIRGDCDLNRVRDGGTVPRFKHQKQKPPKPKPPKDPEHSEQLERRALVGLYRSKDRELTRDRLRGRLDVRGSRLGPVLDSLDKRGLVRSYIRADDDRMVKLTDSGRQRAFDIAKRWEEQEDEDANYPDGLPVKFRKYWDAPWKYHGGSEYRGWLDRNGFITPNFTWAEARCKDGTNVPGSLRRGCIAHAWKMEVLRHELGDRPIPIISWYRTPSHNASVGGASDSRHMQADACNIPASFVAAIGSSKFDAIADKVFWNGGFGRYPAGSRHCDSRGFKARW